jgi:hypothetical protein
MSDYGFPDKRRKGKDKKRERKKHPYRKGGSQRSSNIELKDKKKYKCED